MKTVDTAERGRLRKIAPPIVLAVSVAAIAPMLLGRTMYAFDVIKVALVYALFTVSWDIYCGLTGETSFGHSFFIGAAAYAAALAQSRLGLHPALAISLGTLIGACAGLLLGVLTLRHTGAVFAMVTMAVQLTFHRSLFIWSGFFGGEEGVLMTRSLSGDTSSGYWLVAAAAVGGLLIAMVVRESRLGRQLRASGGDTRIGMASGVHVPRARVLGATLSGLLAGIGGSLLAMQSMLANHEMAGDALAGLIFLLAMIGGAGTLIGPWLAAVVFLLVRESLFPLGKAEPMAVFGILLVCVWAFPDGIAACFRRPFWDRAWTRLRGQHQ